MAAVATGAGTAQWVQASVASNGLAILTLDRPKALNAMNLDMDIIYKKHLDEWASESAVKSVLVEGSTSRAFCAGMDIKGVAAAIKEDKSSTLPRQVVSKLGLNYVSLVANYVRNCRVGAKIVTLIMYSGGDIKQMHNRDKELGMLDVARKVFGAEYSLICQIARYRKPYISLMDGITMGFGIGLSGHGQYRVVTEKTVLAMPENGIGLFPDVGFAHLVARSPGNGALGAYLALTGARISNPADALYVGLATHYVPSVNLSALREALLQLDMSNDAHEKVKGVLSKYSKNPEVEPQLEGLLPSITTCFGNDKSVADSIEALRREQRSSDPAVAAWAEEALQSLSRGAPFSLLLTRKHYARVAAAASNPDHPLAQVEGVMRIEYYLGIKTSTRSDFMEGVRALLIDKDQKPRWQPAAVDDVNVMELEGAFNPLEGHPVPF